MTTLSTRIREAIEQSRDDRPTSPSYSPISPVYQPISPVYQPNLIFTDEFIPTQTVPITETYPAECVKDEKVKTFICAICLEIPLKAFTTKCGHLFCDTCFRTWHSEHPECPTCRKPIDEIIENEFVTRMITSCQCECKNKCGKEFQLLHLKKHLEVCEKEEKKCDRCLQMFQRSKFDKHKCEVLIKCDACGEMVKQNQYDDHLETFDQRHHELQNKILRELKGKPKIEEKPIIIDDDPIINEKKRKRNEKHRNTRKERKLLGFYVFRKERRGRELPEKSWKQWNKLDPEEQLKYKNKVK